MTIIKEKGEKEGQVNNSISLICARNTKKCIKVVSKIVVNVCDHDKF